MKQDNFNRAAGIIFLAVAIVHLTRVVQGWHASIGGWSVPLWVSYVAVIVGAYLGYRGLKLANK